MIIKLLHEVWDVKGIKAKYSAEESTSFTNKEGTLEKKMSSGLSIMTHDIKDLLYLKNYV